MKGSCPQKSRQVRVNLCKRLKVLYNSSMEPGAERAQGELLLNLWAGRWWCR